MKLKLVEKREVAKDTKSFIFEPQGKVAWLPGQYYYYTLPKLTHPDPRGATHFFTIHFSPTEGGNIGFTTRMRDTSGYKASVDNLSLGDTIEGEGPEGTFILDENESPPAGGAHILIAGGIGITPFRSFIKYNIDKKLTDIKLHLIYANSTPDKIAFKDELTIWAKENSNITVDMTVSEPDKKWRDLTGHIDAQMLKQLNDKWKLENAHLSDGQGKSTYWLCGPPPMVNAMQKVLGELNIPAGNIRTESFSGY